VSLDELQKDYKLTLATWKTWDHRHKIAQLVHLSAQANRATELGDPDLADSFDALAEVIAADVERPAVAL
jgi:hypothetical protein